MRWVPSPSQTGSVGKTVDGSFMLVSCVSSLRTWPVQPVQPVDADLDRAQPMDLAAHHVAGHDRIHALGRAGHDEVARLQRLVLGQVGHALGHRPDQLGDVGRLARLAVDRQRDRRRRQVADVLRAVQRADRRGQVERLAESPRAGPCRALRAAGRAGSCPGRRHSRRHGRARRRSGCRVPPCRSRPRARSRGGSSSSSADTARRRLIAASTTASAGFMKKNGGSRSGSLPISRAWAA